MDVVIDESEFAALAERHRRLHVHCYRMLGSLDEAEDLVRETLLRLAGRRGFEGGRRPAPRLYRIATNACSTPSGGGPAEVLAADVPPAAPDAPRRPRGRGPLAPPYPDSMLDAVPDRAAAGRRGGRVA